MESQLKVGQKYKVTNTEGYEEDLLFRGIRDGAEGRRLKFSYTNSPETSFEMDPETIAKLEPEEKEEKLFQVNKAATNLSGTRTEFESCFVTDPTGANCALISTASLGLIAEKDIPLFIRMPGNSDIRGTLLPILRANGGPGVNPVSFDLATFPSVLTALRVGYVTIFSVHGPGGGHMVLLERLGDKQFRILDQQNANREGRVSIRSGTLEELGAGLQSRGYTKFMIFQGPALDRLSPPRLMNMLPPTAKLPVKMQIAIDIAQKQRAKREAEQAARRETARKRQTTAGRRKNRAKTLRISARRAKRS